MVRALVLGIAASFFFAFTFILNQQMNISGGSWIWSSSLRYIFMLIILFFIVFAKKQMYDVIKHIKSKPLQWVLWSTIGFGLFYAPLTFASVYGASWLVAGTWQLTIIAGALLTPLFYKTTETEYGVIKERNKLPKKSLMMSSVILLGIFLMQSEEARDITRTEALLGVVPVIIAAFAYPLGNRKMMEVCDNKFNTFQRVFGMTLCSMPFWMVLSFFGMATVGLPSEMQIIQSFIVAVFSGIIATILFFKATDLVSKDTHKLAVVESTQSGEVVFTLLGGVLIFHDKMPTLLGFVGITLVIIGMILNSFAEA